MTCHSNILGSLLSLKNCSITLHTLEGVEHFENLHKTIREVAKTENADLMRDKFIYILNNYKTLKKGRVGAKRNN